MSFRKKPIVKPTPTEVIELKKFYRAYEKLCANYSSQVNPWIKENVKYCVDNHEILTKIILDFSSLKDTPPVLFSVILTALRQIRYKYIKHIYIWNYPMSYENAASLATYLGNPAYNTYTLHLMDCMLTSACIERISRDIPSCQFLSDVCLDYNNIGDLGCQYLAECFEKNPAIRCLRLNFCGLTVESGRFLHKIITTSTLSELHVDGNNLQCKGVMEMLKSCVDQAKLEAKEMLFAEPKQKEKKAEEKKKTNDQKKKEKKKKKRKKTKKEEPVVKIGAWIEKLHLVDNGIDVHSLEGATANLNCIHMIKILIIHSSCLKELDLNGNEIGNLASLLLLEALEARKENNFAPLKLQSTPKIQMPGLYQPLQKLSSGKLPKKKKKKKKKK